MNLLTLLFAGTLFAAPASMDDPGPLVATDPSQARAHYHFALAKLHADAGDFEAALSAFEKSLELDSSDAYSYLETAKFYGYLAQVSRTRQQTVNYLDKSLELLAQARDISPDNADILRLFAETHLRLGEQRPSSYAVAQGALEKLRELDPEDLRTLVSLGQIYLFSREPGKAADVLTEASSRSPRNRMVLSMLVDALMGADRTAEAEAALADLIPLDPTNIEHSLKLADLLSGRGEHSGAAQVLEAAGEGDWLTGSRVRQSLAREYHLIGEHEKALVIIDKILEDPFAASAPTRGVQRLKASILTAMTRYGDAIAVFEPLLDSETDDERRLQDTLLLSRLYERQADFDTAVELLRRESASLPAEIPAERIAVTIADVQKRAGDLIGAESTLRGALEATSGQLGPEAVELIRELAVLLGTNERAPEAVQLLESSLGRLQAQDGAPAPNHSQLVAALRLSLAGVYGQLEEWPRMGSLGALLKQSESPEVAFIGSQIEADSLAEQGNLEEALTLLDGVEGRTRQVLAKKVELLFNHGQREQAERLARGAASEEVESQLFAARLLQRHEIYPASIELLEGLLPERSDNAVLFALGAAYERTGDFDKAVATFQRLLEGTPGHAPSLNYLGYMWTERGIHLEESLDMILRAVAADPDNGAYVDSLGWVYFQLGRFSEARPHLEWAARLSPQDAAVHEHLGDLFVELNDIRQARASYERALELSDDDGDESEKAAVAAKLEALEGDDNAAGSSRPEAQSGSR